MQNYIQPGDVVTLSVPVGGVTSGLGYQIGQLFVVASNTVAYAAAATFEGQVVGVFDLVAATGVWAAGDLIYWDNDAHAATTDDADWTNILIGVAVAAKSNATLVGRVRLNGCACTSLHPLS